MSQGTVRVSALGLTGVYFFLFLLFAWPVVDLFSNTWTLQMGNIQWRMGFLGLLTAYLHTPLLAIVLAMGVSFASGHRLTLRLLSVLSVLGVVVMLLAMVFFALDAIQMRGGVPAENRGPFDAGTVLSELKFFTVGMALAFLAWGGWRTADRFPAEPKKARTSGTTAEVLKAQKLQG